MESGWEYNVWLYREGEEDDDNARITF